MARTEKGSRIRLPPGRIQLQAQDSITGSFPTISRCSSDGRTGRNSIHFNDLYTPVFKSYTSMSYPNMLPTGSLYITNEEQVTTLYASGNLRKGVGDQFIIFNNSSSQNITAFKDNTDPAVDANSNQPGTNYAFYATGSKEEDVGEGFTSPLWSKQKIEISIPVKQESLIKIWHVINGSIPSPIDQTSFMSYYNKDLEVWEPQVSGAAVYTAVNSELFGAGPGVNGYIGHVAFTPSLMPHSTGSVSLINLATAGNVISTYGFPYDVRYHATGSNLLDLSRYISEPFLLEKAVLEISAAYSVTNTYLNMANRISASINTVFLLNQRENANFSYQAEVPVSDPAGTSVIAVSQMPTTASDGTTLIKTVRDILCFHKILHVASGAYTQPITNGAGTPQAVNITASLSTLQIHDTLISTTSSTGLNIWGWNEDLRLEMISKIPSQQFGFYGTYTATSTGGQHFVSYPNGGRNGLGVELTNGRSFLSEYVGSEPFGANAILDSSAGDITCSAPGISGRYNPYILMPTDKLILGWSQPLFQSSIITSGDPASRPTFLERTRLTIPAGTYKLTLYGSYIRENKEYIDTLNQLLTSTAVHEIIES